jgi:hypothetical protein
MMEYAGDCPHIAVDPDWHIEKDMVNQITNKRTGAILDVGE